MRRYGMTYLLHITLHHTHLYGDRVLRLGCLILLSRALPCLDEGQVKQLAATTADASQTEVDGTRQGRVRKCPQLSRLIAVWQSSMGRPG